MQPLRNLENGVPNPTPIAYLTPISLAGVIVPAAPLAALRPIQNTPEGAQQLAARTAAIFHALWKQEPNKALAFAKAQVYDNNEDIPLLLERAEVLMSHYDMIKVKAAACAGKTEKEKPSTEAEVHLAAIYYGSLSAARRITVGKCYCPNHACKTNPDCEFLAKLFKCTETSIKPLVDRILEAACYPCDNVAVRILHEKVRRELAAQALIELSGEAP